MRNVCAIMLSLLLGTALYSPADAQGGGSPQVDSKAVAELARAEKLYADDGKLQDALKIALAQVKPFQETKDYDHLVDCLFLIGNCYYELGDWAKAEQFMVNANDLGWQTYPDQMGTGALKIIGEAQFQQDKVEAALSTFQQRVQKLKKQGSAMDQGELAGALFDVAGMMITLQRPDEALPLLLEAQRANEAQAGVLAKPETKAALDDKDANALDHAEIAYHQAIALFQQGKFAECRTQLLKALGEFDAVQAAKRTDVADRLVAVLDDLVVSSEKLDDKPAAEQYRARRDELNQ